MPKSPIVEHWFRGYESPMKAVVLAMREILLAADPRLEEQLKWQSPTFVLGGHLASFFPRSREHARLMFPLGSTIPGDFPSLEVSGATSRVLRVRTLAEVEALRDELTEIVRAWARARLGEGDPRSSRSRSARSASGSSRAKGAPKSTSKAAAASTSKAASRSKAAAASTSKAAASTSKAASRSKAAASRSKAASTSRAASTSKAASKAAPKSKSTSRPKSTSRS
ncbi:MAG: DUF1801 domain-containing protein [Sandaracinaceae bacterium]|nr:DUF1801 domain-containing protein [Sandaracinaceae bacterium]